MIENQTDKYQDAYQKALSNIQDPTDVQKKALEYGEELEKTIKNIILFNIETTNNKHAMMNCYIKACCDKQEFADYKFVVGVKTLEEKEFLKGKFSNVDIVSQKELGYKEAAATSKIIISNKRMPYYFMARKEQIYVRLFEDSFYEDIQEYSTKENIDQRRMVTRDLLNASYIFSRDSKMTEEYLKEKNMAVLKIEEFEQLNTVFFKNCERNYHPAQIVIEYNGMWKLEDLLSIRYPRSFELQGVYSTVNGMTLDMYLMNMRNMLMEQLTESELIVVNRCADGVNRSGFRRALKVQNPMAQLLFEDMQGKIIEPSEEDLPNDVKGDKIVLDDVDFGVWYVDAYDHPELYLHKEIDFKGQIFRPKGMPDNMFVPVREIMTCCADDVRYYGYPCKAEMKIDAKTKSWMQIRARFEYEAVSSFGNKQPVLYLIDMEPAAEPEDKVVYLG